MYLDKYRHIKFKIQINILQESTHLVTSSHLATQYLYKTVLQMNLPCLFSISQGSLVS